MAGAEDTRVTVTEVGSLGRGWGLRRAELGHVLVLQPPGASVTLLPLQLCLGGQPGGLEHGLLPEVSVPPLAPHPQLFLINFGEPGEELVCLTLRHFGVGQERVPGLGLPGHDGLCWLGSLQDGHGGGGPNTTRERREEESTEIRLQAKVSKALLKLNSRKQIVRA